MSRVWNVLKQPTGAPVLGTDIEMTEVPIPSAGDGEYVIKNMWMSLDPYIRGTMNELSYGRKQAYPRKMTCGTVGQVIESNNSSFPIGSLVNGQFGWCDYAVGNGKMGERIVPGDWEATWALGILGMPGATAYYGFLDICKPQGGETVVVSSCTGAVGALVGQIAKIKGCKVIGFAGSDEKCKLALDLGYDHCIKYTGKTTQELTKELTAIAPDGVNCYFDNSGGPCTESTLMCLAQFARVSVCGQIAYYNLGKCCKQIWLAIRSSLCLLNFPFYFPEDPLSASAYPATMIALSKQAKIEGFIVNRWPDWTPAFTEMAQWMREVRCTASLLHAIISLTYIWPFPRAYCRPLRIRVRGSRMRLMRF
jgi:NADPH-dependent curcumin reductase CurA